ncbi:bifunctional Small GTP-binding protein domain/P-loop containing nucleoside triphosphate hydrolase/Small GTPase [Babesia duncani]|uniref:Bifunctional Small GTP-binding protein domain/P-loop containing nucleoside triphosphate hydrolase/Small GTPase n=1 Tax=Babesia duncani TaxID=323732 RepID=A0AAD9UP43_9APIC|nr:bifunctional Small GTP-binding protein domain/P-loop containing nucleoside triphosphate hydrolase/Small GTPase [Babesia duncani]
MASSSSRDYDHLFKLVLIGDSGVGKSCLLLRFADDTFTDSYITTIGVDFRFRTISVGGKRVKLQIWDTAGQERFRTITSAYYRGADAIVIVYDITDRVSFGHVEDWVNEVNKYAAEDTCRLLLGNKCDSGESRDVDSEMVQKLSQDIGIEAMEVSARTGDGVEKAFFSLTEQLLKLKAKDGVNDTVKSGFSLNEALKTVVYGISERRCCMN